MIDKIEYKTIFLVITLAILAPVFTLIFRRLISSLGKSIYFWILSRLRRDSKLHYKLIENSRIDYNDDFYILLGIIIIYGVIVLINMFGG
jgi:hypothetical protein